MNRQEAFDTLEIDETTDRKAVRRAYLRLIKLHKPDQDPEGFQRIREAYEAASEVIDEVVRSYRQEPKPSRSVEASEPESSPPTESFDPSQLEEAWSQVDEATLFSQRLLDSPLDLDDAELERLCGSDDTVLILRIAELRTRQDARDLKLTELVSAGLGAVTPLDPVPLEASLRLVPRLLAGGRTDLAHQLYQAALDSISIQGGGAALTPDSAVSFYLLAEFFELPSDFPEAPRKIILQGLATNDLIAADDRLMEWAARRPQTARFAARKLQGLPELNRYFHVSLDVPDAASTATFKPMHFSFLILWLLFSMARACGG